MTLTDGQILVREISGYEGFHTHPMSWERAVRKFYDVAGGGRPRAQLVPVVKAVRHLENVSARNLATHLV